MMKKIMLAFLLIAGTASGLSAQNTWYYYLEPYTTAAEALFNSPKPGNAKVNFHFFKANGARITLELVSIKQMNHLPDLDSIIRQARSALALIQDSLKEDAYSRRIDMVIDPKAPTQLRITTHSDRSPTFFVQKDELALLKTEMDTLRIRFSLPIGFTTNFTDGDGQKTKREQRAPAYITILVKNFSDVQSFPVDMMQQCIALLKQDITQEYVDKASSIANYSAYYNMQSNKRFSPKNTKWIRYGQQRNELVPNIYGSVQFVRGSFVPSMAAGLRFSNFRTRNTINRFYLMWEPYFFFRRDIGNNLLTERNDFVTFRYIQQDELDKKKPAFDYVGNFSLGYLVYKKGEWFEKNTVKLGLPGVRSGWLQLEPELFFNNFLRNFSPSLKLTLHYE